MVSHLGIYASQISGHLAPPNSYESISTVTVGSGGSSSISFSSIPSTYKHLQIRAIARTGRTGSTDDELLIRFNGSSSGYYRLHYLQGNGSAAYGGAYNPNDTNGSFGIGATADIIANSFSASVIDILDYQNTNKNKTLRGLSGIENNGTGGNVWFASSLWMNTAAISSLVITPNSATNFAQYSQFALYGIKG